MFTIDAEFVLDKWTVINDDTIFFKEEYMALLKYIHCGFAINARKHLA